VLKLSSGKKEKEGRKVEGQMIVPCNFAQKRGKGPKGRCRREKLVDEPGKRRRMGRGKEKKRVMLRKEERPNPVSSLSEKRKKACS